MRATRSLSTTRPRPCRLMSLCAAGSRSSPRKSPALRGSPRRGQHRAIGFGCAVRRGNARHARASRRAGLFQERGASYRDAEGHIIKVGWIEAGMALKVAYGDEDGFDLWGETHEDAKARADAPGQWPSFAAEAQPGHVTIGTIIKAAKDAGFRALCKGHGQCRRGRRVRLSSYGPFTMDPERGAHEAGQESDGARMRALRQLRISAPFEVLGAMPRPARARVGQADTVPRCGWSRCTCVMSLTRRSRATPRRSAPNLLAKGFRSIARAKGSSPST